MLERLLDIGIKCGRLWEVQRFLSQVRTKQRDDNIQIIEYFKLTANSAVTHLFGTNLDSVRGFIFARKKPGGRG